jgi:hypothetical protein
MASRYTQPFKLSQFNSRQNDGIIKVFRQCSHRVSNGHLPNVRENIYHPSICHGHLPEE